MNYMKDNISSTFMMFPTTADKLLGIICKLRKGNSSGYDNISTYVLKYIDDIIVLPLTHIINLSFTSGIFPSELKTAKICPILKSGDPQIMSTYRPISLLPTISKIIERLVSYKV